MSVKVQKNKENEKAKILRDSARHELCIGEDCPKKRHACLDYSKRSSFVVCILENHYVMDFEDPNLKSTQIAALNRNAKHVSGKMKRPRNWENHGNNRTSLIYTVVTLKYIVEFILKYLTNLQRYTPE